MPSSKTSNRRDLAGSPEPPGGPPTLEAGTIGLRATLGEGMGDKRTVDGIDDLTYREARAALDLTMAELQGSQLDVEAMADLYRRALRYVERCEAVLDQVEQEVMQWDPVDPGANPKPFEP